MNPAIDWSLAPTWANAYVVLGTDAFWTLIDPSVGGVHVGEQREAAPLYDYEGAMPFLTVMRPRVT